MTQNKFLTEKEKARFARNAQIKTEYAQMRKSFPDVSDHRLHIELASKFAITPAMVRLICL